MDKGRHSVGATDNNRYISTYRMGDYDIDRYSAIRKQLYPHSSQSVAPRVETSRKSGEQKNSEINTIVYANKTVEIETFRKNRTGETEPSRVFGHRSIETETSRDRSTDKTETLSRRRPRSANNINASKIRRENRPSSVSGYCPESINRKLVEYQSVRSSVKNTASHLDTNHDRKQRLVSTRAEQKCHTKSNFDSILNDRRAITNIRTVVTNESLDRVQSSVVKNSTGSKSHVKDYNCLDFTGSKFSVDSDRIETSADHGHDNDMSTSRSSSTRRDPIRHWSQYRDQSDTLEERTTFVYRNGRWVHEAKPVTPKGHRAVTRVTTDQTRNSQTRHDVCRGTPELPRRTPEVPRRPPEMSGRTPETPRRRPEAESIPPRRPVRQQKAVSLDGDPSERKGRLIPARIAKPMQTGLEFAKKKWSSFADKVKTEAKTIPTISVNVTTHRRPDVPPKRPPPSSKPRAFMRCDLTAKGDTTYPRNEMPPRCDTPGIPEKTLTRKDYYGSTNSLMTTSDGRPAKPPRPKRSANKSKTSDDEPDSPRVDSYQKGNQSKPNIDDAVQKFERILQSFQNPNDRPETIYSTIADVQNIDEADVDNVEDYGEAIKNRYRDLTINKPEYNKQANSYSGCISNTAYKQRLIAMQNASNVTVEKFDKFNNNKPRHKANNDDLRTKHSGRTPLPVDDRITYDNTQTVGDGPTQTTIDNRNIDNSFEILGFNNETPKSPTDLRQSSEDYFYEDKSSQLADDRDKPANFGPTSTDLPIAGNISTMNKQGTSPDVELRIREDDDADDSMPVNDFVNVQRSHSGYRSRRIRSIGPRGEFKETTQSSSNATYTRHLSHTDDRGKVAVLQERHDKLHHKTASVMGNKACVASSSVTQLDQAASERRVSVTDGDRTSVKVEQRERGRSVDESARVGRVIAQSSRTTRDYDITKQRHSNDNEPQSPPQHQAVVERHSHESIPDTRRMPEAVITIPDAGSATSSCQSSPAPPLPAKGPPTSPNDTNRSPNLGSRYRVVNNSFRSTTTTTTTTTTETVEWPPPPPPIVTDTDRAVLVAAIEGRLKEKERDLFNPNATHPSSALVSSKTKIPSREEEEALARARILAQARAGMGGRATLRKRNLIVDEEMMEILFLRCIICQDRYNTTDRTPKLLPCHHTFCLHCLKEMFRVEAEHRQSLTTAFQEMPTFVSINCPTCRENHMINDRDCRELKSDQTVIELLEISTVKPTESVGYCQKHRTQTLDYFCETCVCSVCSDCRVLDHSERNQHQVYNRSEALQKYSSDVKATCDRSDAEDQILSDVEARLQAAIDSVDSRLSETVDNIKQIFDTFKDNINNRQKLLLERLTGVVGKTEEDYSVDLDGVTQRLAAVVKTRACVLQAKQDEDVEQMFVNQKTGTELLSDPFDLITDRSPGVKAAFTYEKRDRANVMSTISDHGMFQS